MLALVKELPPVRSLREWRYERRFASNRRDFLFRGVYASFAEAAAAAPASKPVGCGTEGTDQAHRVQMSQMASSDYPVAFWLQRLLTGGMWVNDFGGHMATKYFAMLPYLPQLTDVRWTVCDLPLIVESGRTMLKERGLAGLDFTSELAETDGAEVMLASGAIQYVETPIWSLLASLRTPPRHVLVNKLPWHDAPRVFTIHSIQVAFAPYAIFNREELLGEMMALGYELADRWPVLDRRTRIPFHPEVEPAHVGLYFHRVD
jgi:putative methyltransferase (TIGR04325 family)